MAAMARRTDLWRAMMMIEPVIDAARLRGVWKRLAE
jgi:hypothetical protein